MLDAGLLRHRVDVQRPVYSQDSDTGAMEPAWMLFKSVWAGIEPLSAKDLIAAQAGQSKITARILIRYLPGLTADMRIVHGSTIYNIEGVLPDKDSGLEYITLPVSTGVRPG